MNLTINTMKKAVVCCAAAFLITTSLHATQIVAHGVNFNFKNGFLVKINKE